MNTRGFTLIEFMIIIATFTITAAITIPQLSGKTHKSSDHKQTVNLTNRQQITSDAAYRTADGTLCYVFYSGDKIVGIECL